MELTIKQAVDRYAELQAQIDGAKLELDNIKALVLCQDFGQPK